jgi:hypothetical protein
MTDPALRERAALDVLNRLPEWWRVGQASYDPGAGRWSITARGPHPGRGKKPETVSAQGEDEVAAMTYLSIALDERHRVEQLQDLDRRGRLAFVDGAEEESQAAQGRPIARRWGRRDSRA